MTFGVCYHTTKSILDELETTKFSLGQIKIKRVAIIQFGMNKCCTWLLWMQFPNQDTAVCDGGHACYRSRLY